MTPNPPGTNNPTKKAVHFAKGPGSVMPAQTRSHTRNVIPTGTQLKSTGQPQVKPIIKTNLDTATAIREVQSEDEEPYPEDELEDLANLPTDSEPDDLGDLDSEDYDDTNAEQ